MTENPQCPNFSSHYQNAYDRLFPGTSTGEGRWQLTDDESELVDAEAEREYLACEGH